MEIKVINFSKKLELFSDHWTPKVVAKMNENHFKLVKIQGEFVWHKHVETDETFIVIAGSMKIELRNQILELSEGEMVVIPCGIEHKPIADQECQVLLIEPEGTTNTGDAGGRLTAKNDDWLL